jgi:hypothetical protein
MHPGLWVFAAGLLIGTFCFRDLTIGCLEAALMPY